jgi:hypothetical protein
VLPSGSNTVTPPFRMVATQTLPLASTARLSRNWQPCTQAHCRQRGHGNAARWPLTASQLIDTEGRLAQVTSFLACEETCSWWALSPVISPRDEPCSPIECKATLGTRYASNSKGGLSVLGRCPLSGVHDCANWRTQANVSKEATILPGGPGR